MQNTATPRRFTLPEHYKIGIACARFNTDITDKLLQQSLETLTDLGAQEANITVIKVPGAVELPLTCQHFLRNGAAGAIALGAVIRGDTPHFDYVCNIVSSGIIQTQLQYNKPIAFGVLTCNTMDQAHERVNDQNGATSALTLAEMLHYLA